MSTIEVTPVEETPVVAAVAVAPEGLLDAVAEPAARAAERWRLAPALSARQAWTLRCVVVDVAAIAAAAVAAGIAAPSVGLEGLALGWTLGFGVLLVGLLKSKRLYRASIQMPLLDHARTIVVATGIAAITVLATGVVMTGDATVAAESVRLFAFSALYLTAGRTALYWSTAQARRHGNLVRPTLILGAGRVGRVVAERLLARPELGLKPVAFLDEDPGEAVGVGVPVLGTPAELEQTLAERGIEHVIVAFATGRDEDLLELVGRCERAGATVSIVPRLYEKVTENVQVEHLGGLPLLTPERVETHSLRFHAKDMVDRLLAAVGILLVAPVLAACALAVYLSMGRPILFRQVRIGRQGREFELFKFRSMRLAPPTDALDLVPEGSAPGGVEGVDRRTRVGTFLRKTSLDELPQLFNVLKGDMSVIGPRPERPEFVELFERDVYRYGDRHRVKAGITGWAQVHGLRGKTSIADRAEWDNYYIENFSLWLDLKILLKTVAAVVTDAKRVE